MRASLRRAGDSLAQVICPARQRSSSQPRLKFHNARGMISDSQAPAGTLEPLQLRNDRIQRAWTFHPCLARDMLPGKEKAHEIARTDRLDFRAQTMDRVPMNAREQPPLAPFFTSSFRA